MNYHDVLAKLGVSNAHPGGAWITTRWIGENPFRDGDRVLDIGCGNGATACAVMQTWKVDVTALDIRSQMVQNTVSRAKQMGLSLTGVTASAEKLPFPDNTFDGIVCESVLVFVDADQALQQFARVLKPGGKVISVEMMTLQPVSEQWKKEVHAIYGAVSVPDFGAWKRKHRNHGFDTKTLESGPIARLAFQNDNQLPTGANAAIDDPQVLRIIETNGRWLEENQHTLGYGVFLLTNTKT